ncbi:MAG TPA: thioesterase family protein [Afifellaceae bacterium]|nr:thioesterase family protein [Afifellaceae bacterium]
MSDFPVPFRASPMRVQEEWIDYNGHMNVAYYVLLFDRCVDEAFKTLGMGHEYVARRNASFFTVEIHIQYLRELPVGTPVQATLRLLAHDAKRLRVFMELFNGETGDLSATADQLFLHVDMARRRSAPFPDDIIVRVEAMRAAHAALPWPEGAGRAITLGSPG